MAHEVESMMYTNQIPWHNLGTYVGSEAVDSVTALEQAGLDWEVLKKGIRTTDNLPISDHFAIVRSKDKKPLGIVGNKYHTYQNTDAFQFFDSIVGKGKAIYHTAGSLKGGKIVWLLAKLPEAINLMNKDLVDKYLLLMNSHDGSTPIQVMFTPVRIVCNNTLNYAVGMSKQRRKETGVGYISVRHTKNTKSRLEEAKRVLDISIETYDYLEEKYKDMTQFSMDEKTMNEYINRVLRIGELDIKVDKKKEVTTRLQNQKDRIIDLYYGSPGAAKFPNTLWNAYNAFTRYADWEKTVKREDEDPSNRANSLLLTGSAHLKGRAFDKALKLME